MSQYKISGNKFIRWILLILNSLDNYRKEKKKEKEDLNVLLLMIFIMEDGKITKKMVMEFYSLEIKMIIN